MLSKTDYNGPFKDHLRGFIEEKKKLGRRYVEEARLAEKFDELSKKYPGPPLSKEIVLEFIKMQDNWAPTTQKRRVSFISNFGRYLLRNDIDAYLPAAEACSKMQNNFTPYVFTRDQIEELFSHADNITPNCRLSHIFYPVFLRLLYCTGMRVSEALNLKMKDVDLTKMTIMVRNPKNNHDRLLPISPELTAYLKWYSQIVHPTYYIDDWFFMSNRGNGHYYRNNIHNLVMTLIEKLKLPSNGYKKRGNPNLHSFRHTFCIHSLQNLLEQGIPSSTALQYLSTYMGHQSIDATGRYLQLTAEAYPELRAAVEEAYKDMFPDSKLKPTMETSYEEE